MNMTEGKNSWLLFVGGVALGSAAAAGVGYAITRYYIENERQREASQYQPDLSTRDVREEPTNRYVAAGIVPETKLWSHLWM